MLTVADVTKKYGSFTAIENISIDLSNGMYGLLAPNGAGKTTLIKMISTLLEPTSGEILLDGMEIRKMGADYRTLLGYLPQHFGYYRGNTPVQYLDYLAALKGMDKRGLKERIQDVLTGRIAGFHDNENEKVFGRYDPACRHSTSNIERSQNTDTR